MRCKAKRRKYIEIPMGLISEHQLKVSPPFWISQMDFFGPFQVYVPGFEKSTRNRQALKSECNVLIFACPVTRLINLQVVEKKDSSGVVDGITRLACEVGIPKLLLIDKDSAIVKSMSEVEFHFQDAAFQLHREHGIEFLTCPVSGHNQNGQVERRIRTVQDSLRDAGIHSKRLHATGLQTILKLIENQINNMPLGYSYSNDQDNTPLLKLISPNMLRVGRNNSRALDGPMRLPRGGELLDRVQETYESWYKIWSQSYIPKLLFKPKWWSQETDLKEDDIVLFQKKDSVLEHAWTMGKIDQLIVGRDKVARRAIVKYQNGNEDFMRTTDRSVRSLVKLFSIDEFSIDEDLEVIHGCLAGDARYQDVLKNLLDGTDLEKKKTLDRNSTALCMTHVSCCCRAHCTLGLCPNEKTLEWLEEVRERKLFEVDGTWLQLRDPEVLSCDEEDVSMEEVDDCDCTLTSLICNMDLNLY